MRRAIVCALLLDLVVILLVIGAYRLVRVTAKTMTAAAAAAREGDPPIPLRLLRARDGYDPIAIYDQADKRLTVTDHAAADMLLCITYGQKTAPVCKLPADWVGR